MKISIVIPAFNEEKLIVETLRSINTARSAFAARGWESEVIVCDNNSTDHTAELARSEWAAVVFEPVNQIGRARNRGAMGASGQWIIFVDADTRPSVELFAEVADQIAGGECVAGGCTVRFDEGDFMARLVLGGWNFISRARKWAAGSFIFCETSAFFEVGGFSADLYATEEIDLSIRLGAHARRNGRKMSILHRHPIVTSARKMHLYSKGEHVRFILKTAVSLGGTLRKRDACTIWYDGRR